ncbi:enoyl-CoA hydratase/carnithine racemase [Methylophilaceae bacterium 11]|jgi:DSF synthase|uniref:crotonase/enoyl-CoA hydratase family protein n=1 Tax=unclassified Methylotenera TaxID=2643294 RepID=UPI00036A9AC0|nr:MULTISPECIES: crotonase/enoyl-CoA hydratase family protein [unclassified Methylotenera]EUJ10997.1 enoyl-CoA hydratase/carnithine racemase [Methylophilaceae bacterium 11]
MNISEFGLSNHFKQLSLKYDESHEVLWTYFNQKNIIPCANHEIIHELTQHQQELEKAAGVLYSNDRVFQVKYSVAASLTPNVFNLGGHLALIRELALNKNKDALLYYAIKGIDILHSRLSRFNNSSIVNITLVQGLALGGGLEGALASDVIIAERKSYFGFPEILFNMFPGMGGYSLVARKAGMKVADEMILKGKQYTAEQAFELGLVDVLVDDGQGEKAVYEWIEKNKRYFNGYLAAQRAKNRVNPITYDELLDITKIWVDTALKLGEREFSIMDRFIYSQEKQYLTAPMPHTSPVADNVVSIKRAAS